jgi:hypothetical protein
VSASHILRADQGPLRVSTAVEETKRPTAALFVVSRRTCHHSLSHPRAGWRTAGAAQAHDRLCEALWPGADKQQESVLC